MREYEVVFVAHPDLDENALNDLINKVRGWITEGGGEVSKTDLWGKRKLAYPNFQIASSRRLHPVHSAASQCSMCRNR